MENKLASLFVVSLGKTLNEMLPFSYGRQVRGKLGEEMGAAKLS